MVFDSSFSFFSFILDCRLLVNHVLDWDPFSNSIERTGDTPDKCVMIYIVEFVNNSRRSTDRDSLSRICVFVI